MKLIISSITVYIIPFTKDIVTHNQINHIILAEFCGSSFQDVFENISYI